MTHHQFNGMTVSQVKDMVSGSEFVKWIAYNQLSPIDSTRRLENMIAQLTALLFNINSKKRKKATDFLPDFGPRRPQTPEEMERALDRFFKGLPS